MARRGNKRTGARLWEALGLLGLLTAGACFDSKPPASGNSNWLSPCDTSDDCADGTSCECGVCAITCDATSDCSSAGEGAVCGVAAAWGSQCESQSAADARVCTVECDSDDVCEGAMGAGFICVGTACLSSDGFMSRPGGTGGDAGSTGGTTGGDMGPTGGMTGGDLGTTGGAGPDTGGLPAEPGPVDGDGECDSGETPETAPGDCAVPDDGLCTGDENPATTPQDCRVQRVDITADPAAGAELVSVSANGRRVVYAGVNRDAVAHVRDLGTGAIFDLVPDDFSSYAVDELSLSDDGQRVLIETTSSIEFSDSNRTSDVYVVDVETGAFTRASLSPSGDEFASASEALGFSADGAFAYYRVDGTNYAFGIATGERLEVDAVAYRPGFSADGALKVGSTESSLVPEDVNGVRDVYLYETGQPPALISTSTEGNRANDLSSAPTITRDGRLAAFITRATNFEADAFREYDVYVKDRVSGQLRHATPDEDDALHATWGGGTEYVRPQVSGDGRYLVYVARKVGNAGVRNAFIQYIGDWVDSLPDP